MTCHRGRYPGFNRIVGAFENLEFKEGIINAYCSFVWEKTKKGHWFWETINNFFMFNVKSSERMEKYKLFEEVSILKKHLKLTKKHDFK